MKRWISLLMVLTSLIFLLIACKENNNSYSNVFILENIRSDAKFINNFVIANNDDGFLIIDSNGEIIKTYSEIKANWIDSVDKENIIVYENFNKETGIAKFDNEYNLIKNNIIMTTDKLNIDPTITKVGDIYYLTTTEIEGNINNGNINEPNGVYTVKLWKTTDLKNIQFVTNIISYQNNIEDVDFVVLKDKFGLVFEKEMVDKGDSSVCIIFSEDLTGEGFWNDEIELLPADCDHEPAAFLQNGNRYTLYYSCDKEDRGESYSSSKIYYAQYSKEFECIKKDQEIPLTIEKGTLLYDVTKEQNKVHFLYVKDYLTDSALVLDSMVEN